MNERENKSKKKNIKRKWKETKSHQQKKNADSKNIYLQFKQISIKKM